MYAYYYIIIVRDRKEIEIKKKLKKVENVTGL